MKSITIVYVHVPNDQPHVVAAEQYVKSVQKFPGGYPHSNLILCQEGMPTAEMQTLFNQLPNCRYYVHDDSGWDIGGFIAAAAQIQDDVMLCLGSSATVRKSGWLARMMDVWEKQGPGLYGSLSSYQVRPHLNTTGFWCSPAMLLGYPQKVLTKEDRYEFEHGLGAFWRRLDQAGHKVRLVTWCGEYDWKTWRNPPNISCRGTQENCLTYFRINYDYERCCQHDLQGRLNYEMLCDTRTSGNEGAPSVPAPVARAANQPLEVFAFSYEPVDRALAQLRLAGPLRRLEQQNQARLHWCTVGQPITSIEGFIATDLVIVQREFCGAIAQQVLVAARELNKPVVFEVDSLLTNVPKSHPSFQHSLALKPGMQAMLRGADHITVPTEALKRQLEQAEVQAKGKIHVVPNCIDPLIWRGGQPRTEKSTGPFAIGLVCSTSYDEGLELIKPAIVQLAHKHAGRLVFKVWGFLPKTLEGIPGVTLVRGVQTDFALHAHDLLQSQLDLALAPIGGHPFEQVKSDLKWLEFSACYIPGIYSAQPPYTGSVENGRTGLLVENTPDAWVEAIENLMRDSTLRRAIAVQAHDEVFRSRTIEAAAKSLHDLYRSWHAAGPRVKTPANATGGTKALDNAYAHLLLHQAEMYRSMGQVDYAANLRDQAVFRYIAAQPVGTFFESAMAQSQASIRDLKISSELSAKLAAARAVADAGVKDRAIQLYMDTVLSLKNCHNCLLVIRTIADVARALLALDQPRGRELLKIGAELARSTGSAEGKLVIDKVTAEYNPGVDKRASRKTEISKQSKPPIVESTTGIARSIVPKNSHGTPEVSIILPAYNNVDLTRACLDSITRTPTAIPYEIVVVNNGSNDGTADLLREQSHVEHIRTLSFARNVGFAHASNQGARAARGRYLLFLNNDTVVTPGWMDALVQAIRQPQIGLVGAKLLYADGRIQHAGVGFINGYPDHPHRYAASDAPEVNQFRELDMVSGAVVLMHTELFLQLGGFDEVFRQGAEDVDLCLRARAAGWKVAYEPKAVVYHLEGQSVGRFDHVRENLQIFFKRWEKSFDTNKNFIAPQPPTIIAPSRSLFVDDPTLQPNPIAVDWAGSFLDGGSLSHVNRELSRSLSTFRDLALQRVGNGAPGSPAFDSLRCEVATCGSDNAAITVRHQWPPDWSRPKQGALLVIQPWEFGTLPADWVRQAAGVDEFWAYTHGVRQTYIASGVDPAKVKVVPLGIDPAIFRSDAAPAALATTKRFKFLFVGGTIQRKGPDVLLAAYLNSFSAADDVCLVIKDFGGQGVYAGQTLEDQITAAPARPNAPQILYLNEELPPEALPGLYTACDALVHPYRGEGFGLPILEAMACGLPVLVTAGGSADDFATEDYAYKIPATKHSIGDTISGLKLAGQGWLLEPDVDALGERMKWVVNHRDEARALGARASTHARTEWTWARAAAIAASQLHALSDRQAAHRLASKFAAQRKVSALTPPSVALVGDLTKAGELFRKKSPRAAWEAAREAIRLRPHHPEAFLLLAEIARLVGDSANARNCAQHAQALAPSFKPAKKFLKGNFHGNTKPEWMVLPPQIESRTAKAKPKLSVCLIVKNEERFIRQCLASVKDFADQIVVVDTGSTDQTVAIAREFGAEIHEFKWCDDFSAARNAALQHVTGEWVLAFDADEELPAESRGAFLRLLQNESVISWRLPLFDIGRENEGCNYVPRLFRNAPGLHFVGRVHEQVFYSVEARRIEWGLENRIGDAALRHHGYTKELIKERGKIERNLRLLELAVEETPGDPLLHMNLGLELCRSERNEEGIRQYRIAFDAMSQLPPASVTPETREALLTQYCTHLRIAKRPAELLPVLNSPLARQGVLTASQHFLLGLAHMEQEQFAAAAEQMRHCLAKRSVPSFTPVNADILTVIPQHSIALCLWHVKDAKGAEAAFQAAMAEAPAAAKVQIDYAKFLQEYGKTVDALQLLNQFTSANPTVAAAWVAGGQIALSEPGLLEVAVDWTAVAIGHHPTDVSLLTQRGEALLLSGQLQEALIFWSQLTPENKPRVLAARILCEAGVGAETSVPPPSLVKATSQEFVRWYWQLVDCGAEPTVLQLHAAVATIETVLPDAARLLHSAITKLALAESV